MLPMSGRRLLAAMLPVIAVLSTSIQGYEARAESMEGRLLRSFPFDVIEGLSAVAF